MAIVHTAGSQTAVLTTEHTLATITTAGRFVFVVDTSNLAAGENVELRVKGKAQSGDTERDIESYGFEHVQAKPLKETAEFLNAHHLVLTLEQNGGTGRVFSWAAYRTD